MNGGVRDNLGGQKWKIKHPLASHALTNETFITTDNHFLKISRFTKEAFLNRQNEIMVLKLLHQQRFPHTIYAKGWGYTKDGRFYSVYPHLNHLTTLTATVLAPQHLTMIRNILVDLHQLPVTTSHIQKFNPLRFYMTIRNLIKIPIPFDLSATAVILQWVANHKVDHWVLCHSDLVLANLIIHKHQLLLIDFEYAYLNDPLYDVASLVAEGLTTKSMTNKWLQLWTLSPATRRVVWHWTQYQNLKNTLWAWLMWQTTGKTIYKTIAADQHQRLKNPLFTI